MNNRDIIKRETEWLLKEKYPRLYRKLLYEKIQELPSEVEKDIKRLEQEEPVDYVIGFSKFLGCKIDLSLKPLIPRPETEYWTEKAIEEIRRFSKNREVKLHGPTPVVSSGRRQRLWPTASPPLVERNPPKPRLAGRRRIKCLDIFSGSGCIGIAVLKKIENSEVDFVEKEKRFLKQIKINIDLNRINYKRYKIIKSDIFNTVKGKYDYIFANPPYITLESMAKVPKSVLNFEDKKAIFGGRNGLFYIRRFLKEAKNHLEEGGEIYMEFDSFQKKRIVKILNKFHYSDYQFFKDQYDRWRYLLIG